MKVFLLSLAVATALLCAPAAARADSVSIDFRQNQNGDLRNDFVANTNDNDSDWWQVSTAGGIGVGFDIGGLTFTATAWQRSGTGDTSPTQIYVYGDTSPNNGGLAAVLAGGAANPSNTDNLWNYQSVKLAFDDMVTITSGTFRDGDHQTSFASDADVWIRVDSGSWQIFDLSGTINFTTLTGHAFEFFNPNSAGANDDNYRLYVSALTVCAVPEPDTLGLLALGVACLALQRRRSRRLARAA